MKFFFCLPFLLVVIEFWYSAPNFSSYHQDIVPLCHRIIKPWTTKSVSTLPISLVSTLPISCWAVPSFLTNVLYHHAYCQLCCHACTTHPRICRCSLSLHRSRWLRSKLTVTPFFLGCLPLSLFVVVGCAVLRQSYHSVKYFTVVLLPTIGAKDWSLSWLLHCCHCLLVFVCYCHCHCCVVVCLFCCRQLCHFV